MAYLNLFLIVIIALWIYKIQKRIKIDKKLSELAESEMWNTLIRNGVVLQEEFEEANERFIKNIKPALTSNKKKKAQLNAIEKLLREGLEKED